MIRGDNKIVVGLVALAIIFAGIYLVFSSFTPHLQITAGDSKYCEQDADCVPAQCCHATDAVNVQSAPDCTDVACTLVCAPETLDCGQGEVRCVNNRCTALIERTGVK